MARARVCVIKSIYLHCEKICFLCSSFAHACEIGLYEGCIVSCKVVDEVPVLDVVHVTASNEKDWEMLVSVSIMNLTFCTNAFNMYATNFIDI